MKRNELAVIERALRSAKKYLSEDLEAICDETMAAYAHESLDEVEKALDVLENYKLFSPHSHAEELLKEEGFFYVTSVHRDDLEERGFDVSGVTDDQMKRLASRMCDDYCMQLFFDSMDLLAGEMGFPHKKVEDEEEEDV